MGDMAKDVQKALELYKDLSKEQVEEYKEAFALFDKDGNGKIEADELQSVMNHIGGQRIHYQLEDVKKMITLVDKNNDGLIDFLEFVDLMIKSYKTELEELQDAFNVFDADKDGSISSEEIKTTLEGLGQAISVDEIKLIMAYVDVDNDGSVDFDEFRKMMSYGPPKGSS